MRPLTLVLALHAHQPYGEEDAVIARAVEAAYRPLIEALHSFPTVKVALRLGGILPEWLDAHDRPLLARLGALVERGQVEMLTGSHYGAVLHVLPERDAIGQIQLHSMWLERRLGAKARCVALDEGAWDGCLPRLLARAGASLVLLDEGLVRGAGTSGLVEGWYVTEREGAAVGVMPTDRRTSAMMPWASPRSVFLDLQRRAAEGRTTIVAAMPAERFGVWPHSLRWCWSRERGWVRRFLELLVQQDFWLRLSLPTALFHTQRPSGRVFPASGTPPEAGEAALDPEDARAFVALQRAASEGDPRVLAAEPWLEGPPWEAFLVRYDEANRLHKHMLRTSQGIQDVRRALIERHKGSQAIEKVQAQLEPAVLDLLRAQGAAAMHAGPGGGLYRGELRHAAWAALMRADQVVIGLRAAPPRVRVHVADHDCDGQREVLIETPGLYALVRPAAGGALGELGIWGLGNLLNTLARRDELWHDELAADSRLPALVEDDDETTAPNSDEADTVTPGSDEPTAGGLTGETATGPLAPLQHLLPRPPPLPPLHADLERLLGIDRHRRAAFQVHVLGKQTTLANLRLGQHPQLGDFLDRPWQLISAEDQDGEEATVALAREGVILDGDQQHLVRISKLFRFFHDRDDVEVHLEVTNRLAEPFQVRLGVEINLNLDGQRGQGRYVEVPGHGIVGLESADAFHEIEEAHLVLADLHRRVRIQASPGAHLYVWPVETPARTRLGYVSAFQGTCLLFAWDLSLWGAERSAFDLSLSVEHE